MGDRLKGVLYYEALPSKKKRKNLLKLPNIFSNYFSCWLQMLELSYFFFQFVLNVNNCKKAFGD